MLMEMVEGEEPGLRGYDGYQLKFKDCQRANVLPGNVNTEPETIKCVDMHRTPEASFL